MAINKMILRGLNFVGRQKKPFKINMLRVSAQNFLLWLTRQYQSIYIVELGATPFQLGIANAVGGLAGAFIAIPTGWLADKYGIKKVLLSGTPFMALGALIFAMASNWVVIIPAIFIAILAMRLVMTVCPMVCGTCLKSEERATGMQLCDTLSAVPCLISPMVGALIVTEFGGVIERGIRPLYYLQVIGFCLIFILILKQFTNPRKRRTLGATLSFVDDMQKVFRQGTAVKRWILYTCLFMVPWYVSSVYVPLFAAEMKHADQFVLGGMSTASMVVPLLLSIAIGRLADTIGRKKVIYITTPIYCLSLLLLVYAPGPTTLLASGILQGFYMLVWTTQTAMTTELVPTPLLGRWWGTLGLFDGLVSVFAPIVGGTIWSSIGPAYVFFFLIFTQILTIPLLLTVPETLKRKRP